MPERAAAAINGGPTSCLDSTRTRPLLMIRTNLVSSARIDEAAGRLLTEQFRLGLFENPYVDASEAVNVIGSQSNRAKDSRFRSSRSFFCRT